MNRSHPIRLLTRVLAVVAVLALAACGGSVSSSGGLIGGTGLKGPVSSATVSAYAVSNGTMGSQIGTAKTDANGRFSLSIGRYSGPVMLQLSGGTFTDEASGSTMSMASGDVMAAVLPTVAADSSISGIQITPLTSMAQVMAQHLPGGMTDANIASANTAIGSYFMVGDILHVQPINALVAGSGSGATQDAINYGMALGAMSQYAKSLGMVSSSAFVTAMMSDASDGVMNGMMGTGRVMMGGMGMGVAMPASAGTSGLASAMSTFVASAQNKSGVSTSMMQALINRLNASNGQLVGPTPPPMVSGTVRGTAFNGSTKQATVKAFSINNGAAGAQIASAATDSNGNFSLSIGGYAGPVMLQLTGATYTDEATNAPMTMAASDMMTAIMPTMAAGATVEGIWVTPLTSMAQARAQAMSGGMTDANIVAANLSVGSYFMVGDIKRVQPMNPAVTGSSTIATQEMKNYGMVIAAMSQYAKSVNMAASAAFVTAMMNDAVDGVLDGRMGGAPIAMPMGAMMGQTTMSANAGTSGLAAAMSAFLSSSANLSGATVADMAALMQKLTSSGGQLP